MLPNEDVLTLLEEIEKSGYEKSDFERRFLLNIGTQCRTPQKLSPNQIKYLKQIHKRAMGQYVKREIIKRREGMKVLNLYAGIDG